MFPNYLIANNGDLFVWDIPTDELLSVEIVMGQDGYLNNVPVNNVELTYGEQYEYKGSSPLVLRYFYKSGSPYAVTLDLQYAEPLPDNVNVSYIRRRPFAYTSGGRVLFGWRESDKPVSVFLEWESINPYTASVGIGKILEKKGLIQALGVPFHGQIILAGTPEVTLTVSQGVAEMSWYATGVKFDNLDTGVS